MVWSGLSQRVARGPGRLFLLVLPVRSRQIVEQTTAAVVSRHLRRRSQFPGHSPRRGCSATPGLQPVAADPTQRFTSQLLEHAVLVVKPVGATQVSCLLGYSSDFHDHDSYLSLVSIRRWRLASGECNLRFALFDVNGGPSDLARCAWSSQIASSARMCVRCDSRSRAR